MSGVIEIVDGRLVVNTHGDMSPLQTGNVSATCSISDQSPSQAFRKSIDELLEKTPHARLPALLRNFRSYFEYGKGSLGSTDVVTRSIDTD